MSGGRTRASLYGVVGAYLLYMAFGLFQGLGDPGTTMKPAIQILFIVFFTAAGIVLLAAAIRMWRRFSREESELLENMREEKKRAEQSEENRKDTESGYDPADGNPPADMYPGGTGDVREAAEQNAGTAPEAAEQKAGTVSDQKKGDIR